MKIVRTDNFAREHVSEALVCSGISVAYGQYVVEFLNSRFGGHGAPDFFKLVADDYELYLFQP